MKTKGMFKRIAAVTLAALTVVTSSGIDYNLLSANAAESATQVTDVSTESTLQTKNAKVNASSKISFSTDEDLKQAVEDGSYTVDVETNKVKVASIKYNKTLLEMGTDFTATAKRTSATTKKIDGVYKYTYTITITGKGRFTGTAKKTGVTMKSQIKPKVTKKKKAIKKADDDKLPWEDGLPASTKYGTLSEGPADDPYIKFTEKNNDFEVIFRGGAKENKVIEDGKSYLEVAYTKTKTSTPAPAITVIYGSKSNPKGQQDSTSVDSDGYAWRSFLNNSYKVKYRIAEDISDNKSNIKLDNTTPSSYSTDYIASEVKPTVTIGTLTEGTDFEVNYSNNTDPNCNADGTAISTSSTSDPEVTITGMGKYIGTTSVKFNIKKKAVTDTLIGDKKDFSITGLDSTYTGSPLTPTPTIVYHPKKDGNALKDSNGKTISKTLTVDDFEVDTDYSENDYSKGYKNNTDISTDSNKAYVRIHFKGNYSGELDQTFSILAKKLNVKGAEVYINDSTSPVATVSEDPDTNSTTLDATNYTLSYSPDAAEEPIFKVKIGNTELVKDKDYTVERPEPVASGSSGWPNVGTYNFKLTGEGNYAGSSLVVTVKVSALSLDNLTKQVAEFKTSSDGKQIPYVELSYSHTDVNGKTHSATVKEKDDNNKTNFSITTSNNTKGDVKLTLKGERNYTDTKEITLGHGVSLKGAEIYSETEGKAKGKTVIIREFDPFTGEELTNNKYFQYYGEDIIPHFTVEVLEKDNWIVVPYTEIDAEPVAGSIEKASATGKDYKYTAKAKISAKDSSLVSDDVTVTYTVESHHIYEETDGGDINKDLVVDVPTGTEKTNESDVNKNMTITLTPSNQGKYIHIPNATVSGTNIEVSSELNQKTTSTDEIYWKVPQANEVKLVNPDDYKVTLEKDGDEYTGFALITGYGNYSGTAKVALGTEDISSDGFYVTDGNEKKLDGDAPQISVSYTGSNQWPTVLLWKGSGTESDSYRLKEGIDYRVAYVSPDGKRTDRWGFEIDENGDYNNRNIAKGIAVSADEYGNLKNRKGQYLYSDGTVIENAVYATAKETFLDSSRQPIKNTKTVATTSASDPKITSFTDVNEKGSNYKIYIYGLNTNGAGYKGKRVIEYEIVGSSSQFSYYFTVDGNKIKNNKIDYAVASNQDVSTEIPTLNVEVDGVPLEEGKDYTVKKPDNDVLQEPGVKTFRITGKGEYKGIAPIDATYTVTVKLSELSKNDGYLKSTPDVSGDNKNLTLYYDGDDDLTDGSGNSFNDLTVSTKYGKKTDITDYIEIDKGDLYTPGLHKVTLTGDGNVCKGTYSINVTVVVTRANLYWAGDSTTKGNNTESLILPWISGGYSLGSGPLSLKKVVNNKVVDVQLGDSDTIFVDGELFPDKITDTSIWSKVDGKQHKVEIKGPQKKGSTNEFYGETTLYFTIEYDLSNAAIKLGSNDETNIPYTGKDPFEDNSKIIVKTGDKQLTSGTDYILHREYTDGKGVGDPAYSRAGAIKVSLQAVDKRSMYFNENQQPTATYTIIQLQMNDNLHLEVNTTSQWYQYTYDGTEQTPEGHESELFTVSYYKKGDEANKLTLTYGTDYTVTYDTDSINAGKKYVTINGKGDYAGSKQFNDIVAYIINKYDLSSNAPKIYIPNQYYTGKPITPQTIKISDVTGDLQYGTDYTIDFGSEDHTSCRTVTVDVVGTGTNFTGTASKVSFTIKKLNLGEAKDQVIVINASYNRGAEIAIDQYIKVYIPDGNGKIWLSRTKDGTKGDYILLFKNKGSSSTPSAEIPTNAGKYEVTIQAESTSKYLEEGSSVKVDFEITPLDISEIEDQFKVAAAEWTGNEVTPDVSLNGKKITLNGQDVDSDVYHVEWKNNINACAASRAEMIQYDPSFDSNTIPTVVITGKGNYTGKIERPFQIGHPFSDATITPTSNTKLIYNGSPQTRNFTVTYTDFSGVKQTLTPDQYYDVEYPDNITDAGDKVVLFRSTGGPLYGTKTTTYTIFPASGNTWTIEFTNLTMDSTGQYTVQYQGAAITPEVKAYELKSGGTRTEIPLKSGEITYKNNTAAGTASVTVNPNNYEGTKTLYFKILGVDLSGDDVYAAFTDGITRRQYTGTALTPAVTVTFAGSLGTVTLRKDVDFSLTYENNTNAGAADVKITGIGNYSGTKTLDFDIFANLNGKTSVFTIPKQMYTGEAITELTGATLKAGGNDLKLGTDYTLSITSTDSFRTKGTAIFTAQSKYYEGTRTVQFEIGNDASMYNVLGVASTYVYDRSAHKPVPVVTDKQGTVYTVDSVTYASTSDGDNCINAGNVRMQIVITSHGQSVTIPYNYIIEPKNINTASITPIADVDYNGKAHTPTIRITDGTNLLTGSPTSSDGSADFTYTYFNNTFPGTATVSIQGINNYTGVANVYFAINVKAAPQMIVTAMPSGRLKVTWKKVSGVSGYRIFYSSANGTQKQTTLSSSKKSTYITGLTRGVVYTVGLQSFITANGQNGYSTASVQQIATSTSKPKITSAKSTGKGKIKITWKKVSNATAYMVYRKASGSSKWVRVKTTKSTSFTNTGLKSGKKYTYKVISYKQSGVKRSFSKYSTGKTVKAR